MVPVNQAKLHMVVRWMGRLDLPVVFDIEGSVFPDPWNESDFRRRLRRRDCIGLVAEVHGVVVGFAVYVLRKSAIYIRRLAVHPDSCRFDVIPGIVAYLKTALARQNRSRIAIPIRETDLTDQRIFHADGFQAIRLLRNHFPDPKEDAYLMRFELGRFPDTFEIAA